MLNDQSMLRENLRKQVQQYRREFIKRAFVAGACAAPVITSFASKDLVRASSCPGVGNCGNNMANPPQIRDKPKGKP